MAWSLTMSKTPRSRTDADAPRSGRARSAGDILGKVGGVAFKRFGFVQSAVVSRWGEIVGERYAKVSSPESIRFPAGRKSGGVLTLLVEGAHAPLMQHLTPLIIERVNRFFRYEAVNGWYSARAGRLRRHRRSAARASAGAQGTGRGLRRSPIPSFAPALNRWAARLDPSSGPPS